jgi:hypothetical protein
MTVNDWWRGAGVVGLVLAGLLVAGCDEPRGLQDIPAAGGQRPLPAEAAPGTYVVSVPGMH